MRKGLQKSAKYKGVLDPLRAAQHFKLNRYMPSADIAPFVEHYWVIRWDLEGQPPYVSEVLPYPSVNMAFRADKGWITGVTTGKYDYTVSGKGVIIGIMFRPGGFYPFFLRSVATLTDKTMPITKLFSDANDNFRQELLAADDLRMVTLVETLLRAKQPVADPNVARINQIIDAVTASKELRTVQNVAKHFASSERTLQLLFQKYVGVGLKWIIMRYRLQEAAALAQSTTPNWTAIAADLGYSDQSHFTNDFKRIIGKSPMQYAKTIAPSANS